jgi:hypothetical protein
LLGGGYLTMRVPDGWTIDGVEHQRPQDRCWGSARTATCRIIGNPSQPHEFEVTATGVETGNPLLRTQFFEFLAYHEPQNFPL